MKPTGLPGIDVAWLQGRIDWGQVRAAGIEWCCCRMGEAAWGEPDLSFQRNFDESRAAGLVSGGYHVFHVDSDVAAAVKLCKLRLHDWKAGRDLPPIIDFEWIAGAACTDATVRKCEQFAAGLADAFGTPPMLYTNAGYLERHALGSPLASLDTILAHYGVSKPTLPYGWSRYWGHQYSGNGGERVPGIGVDVDRNVFNGTREDFDRWLAGMSPVPRNVGPVELPRADAVTPDLRDALDHSADYRDVP